MPFDRDSNGSFSLQSYDWTQHCQQRRQLQAKIVVCKCVSSNQISLLLDDDVNEGDSASYYFVQISRFQLFHNIL